MSSSAPAGQIWQRLEGGPQLPLGRFSGLWSALCRDLGGRVALGAGVYAAVFVLWVALQPGGTRHRTVVSDVVFLPLELVAAAVMFRTARHPAMTSTERKAWNRVGAAIVLWLLGDAIWAWYEVVLDRDPFPSWADVPYFLFYPCLVWGILTFSGADRTRGDRRRLWLDMAMVMVAATMTVWYLIVAPVVRADDADTLATALNVAYPVGDLILLFAASTLVLRKSPGGWVPMQAVAAGIVALMVADLAYARLSLSDSYEGGEWTDAAWMLAQCMLLLAAALHYVSVGHGAHLEPAPRAPGHSRLPHAAVFVAYGFLVVVGATQVSYALEGLLFGAMLLTALVVARQILVTRENTKLIEQLHLQREQRLEEANRLLLEANEQLTEADRQKTTFLSTISHELQTPLTAIVGFSQLLTESDRLDETARDYSTRISRNAGSLSKLIAELLEFSRLERGEVAVALAPVPLSESVARTIEQLETMLTAHRLQVELESDLVVQADPEFLARIVTNLLANAVKFAPVGSEIGVVVAGHGAVGTVSVLDQGPGVPEPERARIFERFYRGSDPSVTRSPGTGIGLAVVAELTERMDGVVSVSDRDQGGACFSVSLPRVTT